jgi:Zn-finger protein
MEDTMKELVMKMLEVSGYIDRQHQTVEMLLKAFDPWFAGPGLETARVQFEDKLRGAFEEMYVDTLGKVCDAYAEYYTPEDMQLMIEWYTSPTGRKMVDSYDKLLVALDDINKEAMDKVSKKLLEETKAQEKTQEKRQVAPALPKLNKRYDN